MYSTCTATTLKRSGKLEDDKPTVAQLEQPILFAQASMTRLAPVIEEATGRPVLTSPRLPIEYTKRVLDSLNAK